MNDLSMQSNRIGKMFSIFLAFIPVLTIYASPVPGMTLAEVLLVIMFAVFLLISKGVFHLAKEVYPLIFYAIYAWIAFFLSSFIYGLNPEAFIRLMRFTFYYFGGTILVINFLNFELFSKTLINIGKLAACFLFLQYFTYYVLGFILKGFLSFLPIYYIEYSLLDYDTIYANFFRPTSFFLEPAHFSQYMVIVLTLSIFREKKYIWAIIISLSIILSTSAQGILMTAAIWCIFFCQFFLFNKKISKRQLLRLTILTAGIAVIIVWITGTTIFQSSIGRLFSIDTNSAFYARMGILPEIFKQMTLFSAFIGHGFGNVIELTGMTTPGLGYVLYGTGFTGLGFILSFIFRNWRRSSIIRKTAIVLFLMTFVQSSVFMNIQIILYVALICIKDDDILLISG